MALFTISRGLRSDLPEDKVNGAIYITLDTHEMFIDISSDDNESTEVQRIQVSSGTSYFATSNTSADISTKELILSSPIGVLTTGTHITVQFANENTANSPALKLPESEDIYPIYWQGSVLAEDKYWTAGATLEFVFIEEENASYWEVLGISNVVNREEIADAIQNLGLICSDPDNDGNIVITFAGITSAEGVGY